MIDAWRRRTPSALLRSIWRNRLRRFRRRDSGRTDEREFPSLLRLVLEYALDVSLPFTIVIIAKDISHRAMSDSPTFRTMMLVYFNKLQGQPLDASNGTIGRVRDFYFSSDSWAIHCFIVDIGSWLSYYSVRLPASAVEAYNQDKKTISVKLTTLQVQLSATVESDESASKQSQEDMNGVDNVALRRNVAKLLPSKASVTFAPAEKNTFDSTDGRHPHLCSSEELRRNYTLRVCDGELGFVKNFILQHDDEWRLRYLVIQTSCWPGKMVLLPREYIEIGRAHV